MRRELVAARLGHRRIRRPPDEVDADLPVAHLLQPSGQGAKAVRALDVQLVKIREVVHAAEHAVALEPRWETGAEIPGNLLERRTFGGAVEGKLPARVRDH